MEVNDAAALFDEAAYAEMPAMLGRAQHSIRLTFFLFGGPDADVMIDILAAQAARGICVRVLLDRSVGTQGLLPGIVWECRQVWRRLRTLGLDVRLSDAHPLPDWPQKQPLSHSKYIVVDDREAMIGGMNVGSLFRRYHDGMIHLTGPTAEGLGRRFDAEWDGRHIRQPLCEEAGCAARPGQTLTRLLGTTAAERTTEAALRQNLRLAQSSVCVAVCEMGRTSLLDELIHCQERGVSVRVLLCPLRLHALLPKGILNAGAVETLIQAGVSVHVYRLGPDFLRMHLKLAIFDHQRAIFGSSNWTCSGFHWIGETDVELHGGDVVAQIAAQFEADWQRSVPATLPSLAARCLHGVYERLTQ